MVRSIRMQFTTPNKTLLSIPNNQDIAKIISDFFLYIKYNFIYIVNINILQKHGNKMPSFKTNVLL